MQHDGVPLPQDAGPLRLDDVDRQIVAQLQEDSRRSLSVVGRAVGLSASAVKRRVDRLVRDGVLVGFTVLVDPAALGWRIEAFVEVYCEGKVSPGRIRRMVAQVPEVVEAYTVTGNPDALLKIRARDMRHFEEVLESVRAHDGVQRTLSTVVMSRL